MKLCQIVPSLEEQHGGPSKSVRALSGALARTGHQVELLTTRDGGAENSTSERLEVRSFPRGAISRICRSPALAQHLRSASHDIVHHHSVWLRTLHYAHQATRGARIPLVISPRGMLSHWAWRHHSWRKRIARALIHRGALEATAGWHVTSVEEARELRQLGFSQPVCVAPNGVDSPTADETEAAAAHWRSICPAAAQRRVALFYSRFHVKKRVLELIDLWLDHAPSDWLLLLVGIPEGYTPEELETYALRASAAGRIKAFSGLGRPPPYAIASLFLLPSHNENFGMAIAEAMAASVPVLVTDTTPWAAVNRERIGWCVPWTDFPSALRDATGHAPSTLAEMGRRARTWVTTEFAWERSALQLAEFYGALRSGKPWPEPTF